MSDYMFGICEVISPSDQTDLCNLLAFLESSNDIPFCTSPHFKNSVPLLIRGVLSKTVPASVIPNMTNQVKEFLQNAKMEDGPTKRDTTALVADSVTLLLALVLVSKTAKKPKNTDQVIVSRVMDIVVTPIERTKLLNVLRGFVQVYCEKSTLMEEFISHLCSTCIPQNIHVVYAMAMHWVCMIRDGIVPALPPPGGKYPRVWSKITSEMCMSLLVDVPPPEEDQHLVTEYTPPDVVVNPNVTYDLVACLVNNVLLRMCVVDALFWYPLCLHVGIGFLPAINNTTNKSKRSNTTNTTKSVPTLFVSALATMLERDGDHDDTTTNLESFAVEMLGQWTASSVWLPTLYSEIQHFRFRMFSNFAQVFDYWMNVCWAKSRQNDFHPGLLEGAVALLWNSPVWGSERSQSSYFRGILDPEVLYNSQGFEVQHQHGEGEGVLRWLRHGGGFYSFVDYVCDIAATVCARKWKTNQKEECQVRQTVLSLCTFSPHSQHIMLPCVFHSVFQRCWSITKGDVSEMDLELLISIANAHFAEPRQCTLSQLIPTHEIQKLTVEQMTLMCDEILRKVGTVPSLGSTATRDDFLIILSVGCRAFPRRYQTQFMEKWNESNTANPKTSPLMVSTYLWLQPREKLRSIIFPNHNTDLISSCDLVIRQHLQQHPDILFRFPCMSFSLKVQWFMTSSPTLKTFMSLLMTSRDQLVETVTSRVASVQPNLVTTTTPTEDIEDDQYLKQHEYQQTLTTATNHFIREVLNGPFFGEMMVAVVDVLTLGDVNALKCVLAFWQCCRVPTCPLLLDSLQHGWEATSHIWVSKSYALEWIRGTKDILTTTPTVVLEELIMSRLYATLEAWVVATRGQVVDDDVVFEVLTTLKEVYVKGICKADVNRMIPLLQSAQKIFGTDDGEEEGTQPHQPHHCHHRLTEEWRLTIQSLIQSCGPYWMTSLVSSLFSVPKSIRYVCAALLQPQVSEVIPSLCRHVFELPLDKTLFSFLQMVGSGLPPHPSVPPLLVPLTVESRWSEVQSIRPRPPSSLWTCFSAYVTKCKAADAEGALLTSFVEKCLGRANRKRGSEKQGGGVRDEAATQQYRLDSKVVSDVAAALQYDSMSRQRDA
eukprot:PhF_6_TR30160/c0_g1_i1/m.44196